MHQTRFQYWNRYTIARSSRNKAAFVSHLDVWFVCNRVSDDRLAQATDPLRIYAPTNSRFGANFVLFVCNRLRPLKVHCGETEDPPNLDRSARRRAPKCDRSGRQSTQRRFRTSSFFAFDPPHLVRAHRASVLSGLFSAARLERSDQGYRTHKFRRKRSRLSAERAHTPSFISDRARILLKVS